MFDGEQGIALHAMQGNWTSSLGEGEVSWFSQVSPETWDIYSSYGREGLQYLYLFIDVRTPV